MIILTPASINNYKKVLSDKKWQWSFLGTDSCLREKIIEMLGTEKRHCYAKELQDICVQERENYLNWIGEIGELQNNILWWATVTSYKNPISSNLFLNYCYLSLICKWIREGVKKRLLIVENPFLLESCLTSFANSPVRIIKSRSYLLKKKYYDTCISYVKALVYLIRSLKIWIFNKYFAMKFKGNIKDNLNNLDILISTWIENRSFDKNGKFTDPYMGKLNDFYKQMGLKVLTITLPILPFKLIKKSYESKEIIPSIHFVKLSDILETFLKSIFVNLKFNNSPAFKLNGFSLTLLLRNEMIKGKGSVYNAYLFYLAILNTFGKKRISCKCLLYPFENQPWDKMMIIAIRKTETTCKIIACHNISIPLFYLNYFLGKSEGAIHPQPDVIVSNAGYWTNIFRQSGFTCDIRNGGSFRSSSTAKIKRNETADKRLNHNILVLLSSSLQYSLDLLFYLLRKNDRSKTFLLKPHPDTPENKIRVKIKHIPENFIFVGGTIEEWLDKVRTSIHIGTTAVIECLSHGVIVFKYIPERIDLDPLLSMNIKQNEVSDMDVIDVKKSNEIMIPQKNILYDSFNEKTWKSLLD